MTEHEAMLSTLDISEFARLAGINLDADQTSDLREMLHLQSGSGKWRWAAWTVTNPGQAADLIAARALIGLLVLDENILWTANSWPVLKEAFRRLVHCISQMGTPDGPSRFHLDGAGGIRIGHANGGEQLERVESGNRVRFACCRYGAARGYVSDLLIIDGSAALTDDQKAELMPSVVSRPNPQILYA